MLHSVSLALKPRILWLALLTRLTSPASNTNNWSGRLMLAYSQLDSVDCLRRREGLKIS